MSVPDWVQDSIFYQIFPDRFENGDPENDPPNVRPWGEKPTIWGFQGGDLQGVIQRLDYLEDLGINAIYLNPIFQASSNHRYNTTNYYEIDPKLGDIDDFRKLVKCVHDRGMRLILDGVFNHCGRGFFAFVDVLENLHESPYTDWFHIKKFPLHAYTRGDAKNYLGWYKLKSLPKLNTDHPGVRQYIFEIARYWLEQGIDGWRLDVPNEIDDDLFWAEFRDVVKSTNPEAYLVGEIWKVRPRWVGPGHFDGLMNYPLRDALIELLVDGKMDSTSFVQALEQIMNAYPQENLYAHYVPLGSHDTPRLATILKGDQRKLRLFYLVLFCFPGAPAIYYGDEIGMAGGKDPDCRRAFPWDEEMWDLELREFLKTLIQLRHERPELRRGEVKFLSPDKPGLIAFARYGEESSILLVLNATGTSIDFRLPVGDLGWSDQDGIQDLITKEDHLVSAGSLGLHLTPHNAYLLARR